jgi:site-specific recombinase XerD
MTTRAIRDRVNLYLREAGIRRGSDDSAVAAYSLRLTAALLLREEGATTEEIRKRLRLGTMTTARIYLNARPQMQGEAS